RREPAWSHPGDRGGEARGLGRRDQRHVRPRDHREQAARGVERGGAARGGGLLAQATSAGRVVGEDEVVGAALVGDAMTMNTMPKDDSLRRELAALERVR